MRCRLVGFSPKLRAEADAEAKKWEAQREQARAEERQKSATDDLPEALAMLRRKDPGLEQPPQQTD